MTNRECIYRKTVDYKSRMVLEKTIFEGFQQSGNFVLQEIGSRRALHQGWKWAFKKLTPFSHLSEYKAYLSLYLSIYLSIHLSIYLYIYLYIYLSIYLSLYLHLLTVTTTRKTLFDVGSLPNSNAICRTFFYLSRILSTYHSTTSPSLGSDLFLSFPAKFFKLFKGLLIIRPELLRNSFRSELPV